MSWKSTGVMLLISFQAVSSLMAQDPRQKKMPAKLPERVLVDRTFDQSGKVEVGKFLVYENRELAAGRILQLDFAILRANGDQRKPDPVFFLAGGPGQAASTLWQRFADSWMRNERDIVLLSQRGTSGSNRLDVNWMNVNGELQQLLNPQFDVERIRAEMKKLQQSADLTMYSTPIAMDDLNEFRQALGYDKINITGGSYGTRASLVYIRRHGESVRTTVLNGVAPIEFRNPLYHAEEAQRALDLLFDEVEKNEKYNAVFPELRKKFDELLSRLAEEPAEVPVQSTPDHRDVTVQLTRGAFVNSLRFQLYYLDTNRLVPLQIWRAYHGDYKPFVLNAIRRNRALGNALALGMLFSVTAAEDVARISPEDVERHTAGTFLGDDRVRRQMAVSEYWPKSKLPQDYGEPVKSDVPTLILSGTLDPVTSPRWGDLVHANFSNSRHLIVPGAHGVGGPCLTRIQQQFLETASVAELETDCIKEIELPPLFLPKESANGVGK